MSNDNQQSEIKATNRLIRSMVLILSGSAIIVAGLALVRKQNFGEIALMFVLFAGSGIVYSGARILNSKGHVVKTVIIALYAILLAVIIGLFFVAPTFLLDFL